MNGRDLMTAQAAATARRADPSVLDPADIELLLDEIRRYLDVVDAFRVQGCDPHRRTAVEEAR